MLKACGDVYAKLLGWPCLSRINNALFYLSGRGLGFHNFSPEAISGENVVIRTCVPPTGRAVVFDVGANEGEWARSILNHNPLSIVHAFEPQSDLARKIKTVSPHITVNIVAVGDKDGELELFDYEKHIGSQHATLLPGVIERIHRGTARKTAVPVIRLDDYCRRRGISRIDLLKIDVEGYEFRVLNGAMDSIESGMIGAIQFEFNEMNVISRTFLKDFYELLNDRYRIYRLMPHGLLEIGEYSPWACEQFIYQNIVAIKRAS